MHGNTLDSFSKISPASIFKVIVQCYLIRFNVIEGYAIALDRYYSSIVRFNLLLSKHKQHFELQLHR